MTLPDKIALADELLLCPFCGGKAELREGQTHDTWFARCTECQCKTVTSYTKLEPTVTWNTRRPVLPHREALEGWKLVPIKLTDAMRWAGGSALHDDGEDTEGIWKAILAEVEVPAALQSAADSVGREPLDVSAIDRRAEREDVKPVAWRKTLSAIKKIALTVKSDGLQDGLAHIVRLCIDAGAWPPAQRNWTEDASHENGNYENLCLECDQSFIGHKRRVICKACSNLLQPASLPVPPLDREKIAPAISKAFRDYGLTIDWRLRDFVADAIIALLTGEGK